MTAVVTGGGGFAMANFVRRWLEADPRETAIVVDAAALDDAAVRFSAPVRDRIEFIQADISLADSWRRLLSRVDYVVHGAAVTPHAYTDAAGIHHDPEREKPLHVLNVNFMGTAQALDWARGVDGLKRFIYVSTGSVYAESVPAQESDPFPLPEDGYIGPHLLYDLSKYGGELITQRFAVLYGLPAVTVRLSSVFGPMDRQTPERNVRNLANIVAHAAVAGRPLRATSADVVGDYIYAPDAADALCRLLKAPAANLRHDLYNIAYGAPTTLRELVAYARGTAPGLSLEIAGGEAADITDDVSRRTGRWGAYDISRARQDFGWKPRPLGEAMQDYLGWLRDNENGGISRV
ncbi:MAG: UDP-glucose 4-epimerase [Rhodospirillaceae bacterium]|nr:UDP-glucose 4-epimerase [Rhodospirillaceae bacterium]